MKPQEYTGPRLPNHVKFACVAVILFDAWLTIWLFGQIQHRYLYGWMIFTLGFSIYALRGRFKVETSIPTLGGFNPPSLLKSRHGRAVLRDLERLAVSVPKEDLQGNAVMISLTLIPSLIALAIPGVVSDLLGFGLYPFRCRAKLWLFLQEEYPSVFSKKTAPN